MDLFAEVTLLILIATLVAVTVKALKQPIIVSYILTGLLVGPEVLGVLKSIEPIQNFSSFGIALLLFIVGLNLSPNVIRQVGKVSVVAGFSQIFLTSIVGILLSSFLGFSLIQSIYIGIALTFSSTIVILKLLADKGELEKLHTKIIIGTLLIQDVVASIILIIIGSLSQRDPSGNTSLFSALGILALKGIVVVIILYIFSKYVLPRVFKFFADSQEFLFLLALSWAMGLALLFAYLGFSIEIGSLAAGISLSVLPYNVEIASKLRPLRDFFLILFFISLGVHFQFGELSKLAIPILLFSLFVLIGNPLIMFFIMGRGGYSKRTVFMSGLAMAQVSEFSLILISLGLKLGHIDQSISMLVIAVAFVTIAISSYMIMFSENIYALIKNKFSIFVKSRPKESVPSIIAYDVILFGFNRLGFDFVSAIDRIDKKLLVIDYDPTAISLLNSMHVDNRYGDAEDGEFLDELHFADIKMIISTIPDFDANKLIIEKAKSVNPKSIILVVAHSIKDAFHFYEMGVDYVIMPHFLGGEFASRLVIENQFDENKFTSYRDDHIQRLHLRKSLGHEHPNGRKR